MERLHSLVRSLKTARSNDLAPDPKNAYYQLLSYVMQNQYRIFIELLEGSPKFDINFVCGRSHRTLLHMAANVGAFECLQYLLKRGAEPNLPDRQGITPLQVASRNGFVRCIIKLLENGADIGLKNNEGMTAIHWLSSNGRTEVLVEIQKYITNIDMKDDNAQTPLHVACLNGHKSTVLKLIELKADIEMENMSGCTPLYFACRHGHVEVVAELIKRHVSSKRNFYGESPVDAALSGGYSHVCCLLIEWDPTILEILLQAALADGIDLEKVNSVLSYLMFQDVSYRNHILIFFAKTVHTDGMKLLSQSTDYENASKLFLKNINIFIYLLSFDPHSELSSSHNEDIRIRADSIFSGDNLRSRLDSTRIKNDNTRLLNSYLEEPDIITNICEELTGLWSVLESWMCILQTEISNSSQMKNIQSETLDILRIEASNLTRQASEISTNSLLRSTSRNSVDLDRLRWSQPAVQFNFPQNSTRNLSPVYDDATDEPSVLDFESQSSTSSSQFGSQNKDFDKETETKESENNIDGTNVDRYDESLNTMFDTGINSNDYRVIDITGNRLSSVIHGYFLYSQCKSLWKNLSGRSSKFNKFVKRYEDVLVLLVSREPQLIFEHFSFILENPILLQQFLPAIHRQPLKERQKWFYERLYSKKLSPRAGSEVVINVPRNSLLETSCKVLSDNKEDTMKENISVRFHGEEGVGEGVTREWFDLLVKEILNPDCALFTLSADGSTFQPNCNSSINPDHLSYFQFAGRVFGLALYHRHLITAYFTRSFYKHILGIPVNYADVESIDPEYSKNLQWLLDNSIDNLGLDITFAVETDVFGQTQEVELKQNGKSIIVTDKNKYEYVYLAADLRMTKAIKHQMFSFLKGFYEFIPHSLALLFNVYELELMLCGVPDIDIEDWKKNTTYQSGFTKDSETVVWFWEVVSSFTQEEQIQLLQFVTGTSRVPWGGFSNLSGISGSLFTISMTDGSSNMLPTASTCFNLLKFPKYNSKDELQSKLMVAVTCGSVGFEFA